ncbi:putative DNA metabolism protein [Desulfitobacterium dehalogenans ATCC 51507]|uniref:Putative DNA metabolism protein n=1 Tax=Desulfitobacterium dehalogenans (strain ATCC 51507 / DSM 9161 / JW/IU-DC1) TaxID=756499 RepID=I4ABQ3_DESDJ|nr:TIGR03915 family putative DNA repair protein [Desulfitobacterium dehalogenans]AFM01388.1 putative DNA metabolism protein [Desulfitobacterium dehalogenans ATCC 51507]
MFDGATLVYKYDGSFEGLMCCVFTSYEEKEIPLDILPPEGQPGLFDTLKTIETDPQKAQRVYDSIPIKISLEAQELVRLGFLTCAPQKERLIFLFLRLGYKVGGNVMGMLTDEHVNALQKAVQNLTFESHRYKGFVRFSIYNEALVAMIEPQNFVLPLLAAHFSSRYPNEVFMIFDKTHKAALIHQAGRAEIVDVEDWELPEPEESEVEYRRLWQQFYKTIAIESRDNPRCRMNFMPKRFWKHLTEFYPEQKVKARESKDDKPKGENPVYEEAAMLSGSKLSDNRWLQEGRNFQALGNLKP